MNFHIEKIYLWFTPEDKRCITFENNKVNVVRGNSSRGKSNLFAIIDYCLMSDKPNIVEPIINECTVAYGLEFVVNDHFFAVSRMKPETGTASQQVWVQNKPFEENYYPNRASNIRPSDFRRTLDSLFGLTNEYRYPWGEVDGKPKLTVSFRSFLMFNALTENLISSQYEFLNYKFFEDEYVDAKEKREYLMDVLLGIDSVQERKQKDIIANQNSNERSTKYRRTKYDKAVQQYNKYRDQVVKLLNEVDGNATRELAKYKFSDLYEYANVVLKKYTPHRDKDIENSDTKASEITSDLYKNKLLLFNIKKAQTEYQKYLDEVSSIEESLKPVAYLQKHLPEYGATIWGKHILEELEVSLTKLKEKRLSSEVSTMISATNIDNLEKHIKDLEEQLKVLSSVKLKPIEESSLYVALGQLKTLLPIMQDAYREIPEQKPEEYDYVHARSVIETANAIIGKIEARRNSIVGSTFDKYIQKIYDSISVKDNFDGCKTRYNREKERLELSDGKSILNYTNIGSQSNYMYLHICFFLGMHNFLLDNPCNQIGNFLFIDQPSVPYYESSDDLRSNDKAKLLDIFRVIDKFMKERFSKGNDFQIILIEHANETYWTGENELTSFTTRIDFDGEEALVPSSVIKKYRNEN